MPKAVDATDFLAQPSVPAGVCVVYGGDAFLQRQVLLELRRQVLGEAADEFSLINLAGAQATLNDVRDELTNPSLFGSGKRLVVVDDADGFVSQYRGELEDLVTKSSDKGVLVLVVGSWPSNTRLYKLVEQHGLPLACECPKGAKLTKWLVAWCQQRYHAALANDAAGMLVEMVEPELGLLDQEIAKLAAYAGSEKKISAEMVTQLVGGWRVQTAWEMLDAAAAGNTAQALALLDHLLYGGEVPIVLLAQMASSLRRFATAARLLQLAERRGQRMQLRDALQRAGFKPFLINKAESQLRQIGRVRAGKLFTWLIDADLALKGAASTAPRSRFVLEQLICRLAKSAN